MQAEDFGHRCEMATLASTCEEEQDLLNDFGRRCQSRLWEGRLVTTCSDTFLCGQIFAACGNVGTNLCPVALLIARTNQH